MRFEIAAKTFSAALDIIPSRHFRGKKKKIQTFSSLRSGVPSLFFVSVRNARYNYLTVCLLLVQNLHFSLIGQETKGT